MRPVQPVARPRRTHQVARQDRRPAPGIQFVGIPEFADLGTKVSREISAAIAGRQSVDEALRASQELAEQVGEEYR